jgi:hypothetical protein
MVTDALGMAIINQGSNERAINRRRCAVDYGQGNWAIKRRRQPPERPSPPTCVAPAYKLAKFGMLNCMQAARQIAGAAIIALQFRVACPELTFPLKARGEPAQC